MTKTCIPWQCDSVIGGVLNQYLRYTGVEYVAEQGELSKLAKLEEVVMAGGCWDAMNRHWRYRNGRARDRSPGLERALAA